MKTLDQVRWARVMYWIIGIVAILMLALSGRPGLSDVSTVILSLAGTFAGAWLAFKRDQAKDKLEQERKAVSEKTALDNSRMAAITRALFVISIQRNDLLLVLKKIAPYKDTPGYAFKMPAMRPPGNGRLSHSFDDLFFLVDLGEPVLLFELILEEQRFDAAIESVVRRVDFHVQDLQPKMEAAGLVNMSVTDAMVEEGLGPRVYMTAVKLAEDMFRHVEQTAQSIGVVNDKLVDAAKRLYPSMKFSGFVPMGPDEDQTETGLSSNARKAG